MDNIHQTIPTDQNIIVLCVALKIILNMLNHLNTNLTKMPIIVP